MEKTLLNTSIYTLLINPPNPNKVLAHYYTFNKKIYYNSLGIPSLAGYLKKIGYRKLIVCNLSDFFVNNSIKYNQLCIDKIVQLSARPQEAVNTLYRAVLKAHKPHALSIIGFSILSQTQLYYALCLSRLIKKDNPIGRMLIKAHNNGEKIKLLG